MQDFIYLAIPVAFFASCVAFVRGLDRLVRAGAEGEPVTGPPAGATDGSGAVGSRPAEPAADGEPVEVRS